MSSTWLSIGMIPIFSRKAGYVVKIKLSSKLAVVFTYSGVGIER